MLLCMSTQERMQAGECGSLEFKAQTPKSDRPGMESQLYTFCKVVHGSPNLSKSQFHL